MTETAEESDILDSDETDLYIESKTHYIYPSREASWLGFYEVNKVAINRWQAVCIEHRSGVGCGVVIDGPTKGITQDRIELHILQDGTKDRRKVKLVFPDVIPF
jgi:hypothetical protein